MPKVFPDYREEAKNRVIKESVKFFSEKGYHKTKMAEIADSLGVSKGAIYQYFTSKEELFLEVLKYYIEYTQKELISFLNQSTPEDLSTEEFFDIMFNIEQSQSVETLTILDRLFPPLDFNLAISELVKSNPSMKEEMTKYYMDSINIMTKYFEDYKKKGAIKKNIDTYSLSMGITSLQDGLMAAMQMGIEISEIRKTWKEITKMILKSALSE
ncbi:MAG: DNA-binding transcriptional repressor AcrR [Candidatus Methanofastidiosum methylothiophilum]|uniref:DNA-binding transcriptional repressor AcrR n=1 Tax=Candidatus Methanofastidiosum methylothiophilum TaxID=1705564 RepID=A0A150IMV4_9EURY|nr:MAG: DNA-binding transcriptional repressor AcrR [Candidatus Methanofastidiosum methylthiophilus]KYC48126.1 MAG: DNA-binding transcriptional repressor AcrR [Candidatus Methanofastidiosum methylthiophilus]KYC50635.1 MAG: DNA-binding transcriptional repressor AcrR [Candidatus Methanofastidiosum methylthiophilus]